MRRGGLRVGEPAARLPWATAVAGALGGLLGAVGVARADGDGAAGAGEPHGQTEAERAGGADDGDRLGQGR